MFALAALAVQSAPPSAPAPAPSPAYSDPPVRPFEPTGPLVTGPDAVPSPPLRHPPEAPVSVDAYRGHYESPPGPVERAYEQGVAQAERTMDGRMGALDGRWTVADDTGRPLFTLLLYDAGSGSPVEGAWRDDQGRIGVAASVPREDGATVLVLEGRCELRIAPAAGGFDGVIVRDGVETPVRLAKG